MRVSSPLVVVDVALPTGVSQANHKLSLFTSRPAAGFPAPGDDQVERTLDINELVVKNPTATFFVKVEGDSMTGAGIFSGDVLVVDRSKDAKDGSIVVAAVNGELVVKRLSISNKQTSSKVSNTLLQPLMQLVSENDAYKPIVIGEDEECFIWGIVVGSVRQFQ